MNIPKESELDSPKKKGALYIKKRYPEFYQYILYKYPNINKFNAGVYLYFRNMEHPVCPMCGKPTPFLDETRGFQRYCSSRCANSDPEFRKKVQQTCIRKYGTKTPAESATIKQKIVNTYTMRHGGVGNASESVRKKQYDTMLQQYGSEHALCNPELKKKSIQTALENGGIGTQRELTRKKIEQTNIQRYGTEQPLSAPIIRKKIIQTNMERYGVPYAVMNPEVSAKISTSKGSSFVQLHSDIISVSKIGENVIYTCKCPHPECTRCQEKTYEIAAPRYCNRKLDGTEPCTKILPVIKGRIKNTYPELFVRSIIEDCASTILSLNNRTLINPQEIDIYDAAHGLAFECNGCYWHCDKNKGPSYHRHKYEACKKMGVQLITIWEDWIRTKPEIVKSIIRSKYHVYQDTIYGRKCKIQEVLSLDAAEFLDTNHIQGKTKAQCHYGLYYNDKLVSMMSFSKMRGCMGSKTSRVGQWELVRFCTLLNTQVIGAADKLLKHFIRTYVPKSIVSFSSNDISNGALYKRLGFTETGHNQSYWYIGQNYKRYHRSNFTKSAIIKMGFAPDREQWTESEAMMEHGYVRIYDSGQTKWELNIN